MSPVAVARSFSAISYVLPVLKMALCFHVVGPMEQNQRQRYVSSSSPDGSTADEVAVYDCLTRFWVLASAMASTSRPKFKPRPRRFGLVLEHLASFNITELLQSI